MNQIKSVSLIAGVGLLGVNDCEVYKAFFLHPHQACLSDSLKYVYHHILFSVFENAGRDFRKEKHGSELVAYSPTYPFHCVYLYKTTDPDFLSKLWNDLLEQTEHVKTGHKAASTFAGLVQIISDSVPDDKPLLKWVRLAGHILETHGRDSTDLPALIG